MSPLFKVVSGKPNPEQLAALAVMFSSGGSLLGGASAPANNGANHSSLPERFVGIPQAGLPHVSFS